MFRYYSLTNFLGTQILEVLNMRHDDMITNNSIYVNENLDHWKPCCKGTSSHIFL